MGSEVSGDGILLDAVYFAQTHVLAPDHPFFRLVGGKDTLIKVHVLSPSGEKAPPVTATLMLDGDRTEVKLQGPEFLPKRFCGEPGKVEHRFDDCFTATLPGKWIQKGLSITLKAGRQEKALEDLCIGPPIHLQAVFFDIHFFAYEDVDFPDNWAEEIAVRRPVTTFDTQRLKKIVFPELVIMPFEGRRAIRCHSEEDYLEKCGQPFNGKQNASLIWQRALQDAGGQSRLALYFINIANVHAGGYAENFGGCASLRRYGVLYHELAHSLDVEDLMPSTEPLYPYRGKMHGIDKTSRGGYHIGPTWGYDPRVGIAPKHKDTAYFINPVQSCDTDKDKAGEWKSSPIRGGGGTDPEAPTTFGMFSDWSVRKMQSYMEQRIVKWDDDKQSFTGWNVWTETYGLALENNGFTFPVENDVEVFSIMASVSAVTEDANFIYEIIGPYRSGLLRHLDPLVEDDRKHARSLTGLVGGGWDICLRVEQGGKTRTYMMPLAWKPDADPTDPAGFVTRALNVPVRDGAVTRVELLLTPEVAVYGISENPSVLYTRETKHCFCQKFYGKYEKFKTSVY